MRRMALSAFIAAYSALIAWCVASVFVDYESARLILLACMAGPYGDLWGRRLACSYHST